MTDYWGKKLQENIWELSLKLRFMSFHSGQGQPSDVNFVDLRGDEKICF